MRLTVPGARIVAGVALLAASTSCGLRRPPSPEAEASARRAEALVARGSYRCLLEAHAIRRALHERAPDSLERRRDRIRTALLLALRERQLAILGDAHLEEARILLRGCTDCPAEEAMMGAAFATFRRPAGVVEDLDPRGARRRPEPAVLESAARLLSERAGSDAAATALLLSLARSRPDLDVPGSVEDLVAAHADSPLVLVSAELSGWGPFAERALALEETMAEAHLPLGESARALDPGAALAHLQVAADGLPRSVAARLSLGDLLFSLEDYAAALEQYEAIVALAPDHRDAHLHRGQVLHLLGREEESLEELAGLIALGNWYLGEAHYWSGLGHDALGEADVAARHAALAARWLPDDPRVYALAGSLALERGDRDAAEREFEAAVAGAERSSKDWSGDESLCESLYSLGRIASKREAWDEGAAEYEGAVGCYEVAHGRAAEALEAVRGWSLDRTHRDVLVVSRTRRVEKAAHQRAGSLYNAAVCHYRAGDDARALELARRAAGHDAYAERVEKLLAALR